MDYNVKNEEILSTIKFIVIAFVVLPLLPNEAYGPYGFFNPYLIWMMVVLISGISFLSYIAIKFLGEKRGIGATGFLAGLISSTALSLSFSAESIKNKSVVNPYVVAIVVASSAMFFRILVEVAVLNPMLLSMLAVPMVIMGVTGISMATYFWFKKEKDVDLEIRKNVTMQRSPFSLIPALKFGLFFAAILLLSKFTEATMGNGGLYLTSFVSGVVDVDAITVSMANLSRDSVSAGPAVIAITIAAMTNTIVKGGIFLLFGNRKVALKIVSAFLIVLAMGGASLIFI